MSRIRRLIAAAADVLEVPVALLTSDSRMRAHVEARHLVAYISHTVDGRSLSYIGRQLGDRDHTTVLNAIRRVEARLAERPGVADTIDRILARAGATGCKPAPIRRALPPVTIGFALNTTRALQLRRRGWSIPGIARHLKADETDVAILLGESWWRRALSAPGDCPAGSRPPGATKCEPGDLPLQSRPAAGSPNASRPAQRETP